MLHPRVTGAFRALRSYGLLAALIAMGLGLAVTAPGFASVGNGADMLRDLAILGIMAVGETLVIIGGGIDLSVGSILMLAGILSDNLVRGLHFGPFVAVPLVLAACTLVGLINGLLATRARIPAFIVTLAGLYAIRGIALSLYRHDVIGAVVIGGASLLGGHGTLVGTLVGAAFIIVLGKGQSLLGVPANYQSFARGVVILLAVVLDGLAQRRRLLSRVITRGPRTGSVSPAASYPGEARIRP